MGIGDKTEKIEKRIRELVFGERSAREPLKIRQAILDEIEEKIEPVGGSRYRFPFGRLVVHFVAADENERAKLETVFLERRELEEQVRDRLRRVLREPPSGLCVDVRFVKDPGPEWQGKYFHIDYQRAQKKSGRAERSKKAKPAWPKALVVVLGGKAMQTRFTFTKERINIGRLPEVVNKGRLERRNDVVFLDVEDEINKTVSRQHAHISFDVAKAEFRLHDDRSAQGTRIFRDGANIEVPSGNQRGTKLQHRDEICFGLARVRFELRK